MSEKVAGIYISNKQTNKQTAGSVILGWTDQEELSSNLGKR